MMLPLFEIQSREERKKGCQGRNAADFDERSAGFSVLRHLGDHLL